MAKNYFPELTGVRAIAAMMVYFHHFNYFNTSWLNGLIFGMAKELHIGVTFFFVLSGFLIAYRYSELVDFNFRRYFMFRVARIYPMYLLLTTFTLVYFAIKNESISNNELGIYFLNITFIRGFFDSFKFSLIAQGWSLTVEETFYLLAPLIFIVLKFNKNWLYVLPLLFISIGSILVLFFSGLNLYGFFGSFDFMFIYTFFGRCTEFFVGIGLALLLKSNTKLPKGSTYLGLFFTIMSVYGLYLLQGNGLHHSGVTTPLGIFINTCVLPILGISLFYYGLLKESTIFSKILGSKAFVLLGKSSYIFYLIHLGVFHTIINHYISKNFLISFVLLQILSIGLFLFIEEPLNNFIRRKASISK
jgi:peptidoglycan/LPS O-acetylase OafA/YrhL